ncbi:hypothetical protein AX774_g3686, partial [Zancudomyces culisetae]
MLWNRVGRQWC